MNSAFSSSSAIANLANSLSVYSNFRGLAVENFFECTFEWVHDRLALLRSTTFTSTAAHAKHLLKESATTHAAATTSFFDSFQSVPVVYLTLLAIAQNLVGLLNFLELCFVTTTIRMMGPGELMVSFLDRSVISFLILH